MRQILLERVAQTGNQWVADNTRIFKKYDLPLACGNRTVTVTTVTVAHQSECNNPLHQFNLLVLTEMKFIKIR